MEYFQQLVEAHGLENVEISIPMLPIRDAGFIQYTSSSDEAVMVPCTITEDRYKVSENYKVTLVSKVPGFGREHFYQMDLEQMIRSGHAKVRILIEDEVAR